MAIDTTTGAEGLVQSGVQEEDTTEPGPSSRTAPGPKSSTDSFGTMTEITKDGATQQFEEKGTLAGNTGGSLVDQLGSSYDPNWSNVKP